MAKLSLKKSLLAAAAAAMTIGSIAPASAGGRYHGGHGYGHHGGYYGGHYAYGGHGGYYYGSRHYRHSHGHGHLSGGEAALIALGIVGGVVLIDRALERDRYASDPYYSSPPPRDDYYRRDDRAAPPVYRDEDSRFDDGDDEELLGSDDYVENSGVQGGQRYNYGAAYNDCKAETREAARDAGVIVSLPAKPDRIRQIDNGAAVRFTADYVATDRRGGEFRRTMVCEADSGGVRFLELV